MSLILSALPNKFDSGSGEEVLPPAPSFSNYAAKISLNKGSNYGYQFNIPSQYMDGNILNIGFFFSMTGVAHCIFDVTVLVPRPIICTISIYPDTIQTDKARIEAMGCSSRGTWSTAPRYWKGWLWGTTAEKTYGTVPLIEPNKWYYVFASFDVASNTRNTNLDFAKFNGVEFNSNTLGGADPLGYQPAQGSAYLNFGLASRYSLNNTTGLFAYVYGFTLNWGTAQTLTPPTGYASWRNYSDSMMWWRPEEGGQMPEPLANDHMIRSFTSSSNLTSSDGLIRASYTSFEGQAPTNATVANKYIVEPSNEEETNYGEISCSQATTLQCNYGTTMFSLSGVVEGLYVMVFKYNSSYAPINYYPHYQYSLNNSIEPAATSSGLYDIVVAGDHMVINKPSGLTNGWMCILFYITGGSTYWASVNRLDAPIDHGAFTNVNGIFWKTSKSTASQWRFVAHYPYYVTTSAAGSTIPWRDRVAMENYFYSSGNILKPNLYRAIPNVHPVMFFDADSPRGFGVTYPGWEKVVGQFDTVLYDPVAQYNYPTNPINTSLTLATGPRVTIKRKAGPIIVGAD